MTCCKRQRLWIGLASLECTPGGWRVQLIARRWKKDDYPTTLSCPVPEYVLFLKFDQLRKNKASERPLGVIGWFRKREAGR